MSFDGDDLYVADAGTRMYEEVNLVERGGNYGWNVREGPTCHNNFQLLRGFSAVDIDVRSLPVCPNATPDGDALRDPVITYPHVPGGAVIGGAVYRNSTPNRLTGKYVFGDLRGRLFAATPSNPDRLWEIEELSIRRANQADASRRMNSALLAIETDSDGELYLLTTSGGSGKVRRLRVS